MGDQEVWEIDLDQIEVEPGKRITIRIDGGWVELVLDEKVAEAVARKYLGLTNAVFSVPVEDDDISVPESGNEGE